MLKDAFRIKSKFNQRNVYGTRLILVYSKFVLPGGDAANLPRSVLLHWLERRLSHESGVPPCSDGRDPLGSARIKKMEEDRSFHLHLAF